MKAILLLDLQVIQPIGQICLLYTSGNASVGVGLGLMTVVGQCMGAGHVEEARRYILKLSFLGRMLILLFCVMAAVLIKPVTVIAGMEPDAAQMTVQMVWLICAYKPLMLSLIHIFSHR